GDCVDCNLCVAVCPTGIDIRNGTQLECVNCTACIDACDGVMEKIGKPKNLIRYDSMKGIETGKRRIFTPRVLAYTAVLFALVALDVALITNRGIVESIILRSPGQMYQQTDATHLTNLYTFKIINKSPKELADLHFRLAEPKGVIRMVGADPATLAKGHTAQGAFFVELPQDQLEGLSTPIVIQVYAGEIKIDAVKTNFLGSGAPKKSH
ncbi:MAG: 4Fe-4S dicluster domain-containing protein, partial [Saprospiraceae bacterium]